MKVNFLGLLVSLLLLIALIYFSDFERVINALKAVNPVFVLLGMSLWGVEMVLRTVRWDLLLGDLSKNVSKLELMKVYLVGNALSNLSPGKLAEPVRSVFLKKSTGISVARSFPSIIVERITDVVATILIPIFLLLFVPLSKGIAFWFFVAVVAYCFLTLLVLYLLLSEKRVESSIRVLQRIFWFIPGLSKSKRKVKSFSRILVSSLKSYKNRYILLLSLLLSFMIWIIEGVILYLGLVSVGIKTSMIASVLIFSLACLIGVLSFLPGGLGSIEFVILLFFTTTFSLLKSQVMAGILVARFMSLWMSILSGTVLIPFVKGKYKVIS